MTLDATMGATFESSNRGGGLHPRVDLRLSSSHFPPSLSLSGVSNDGNLHKRKSTISESDPSDPSGTLSSPFLPSTPLLPLSSPTESPMFHRRRVDADDRAPPSSSGSDRRAPASSSAFSRLFGSKGDGPDGKGTPTSLRRILILLSPFLALFLFLHFLSADSGTSSFTRGRSMPGFASRSQFAASRRTDTLIRQVKKQRTQASLSHGGPGGTHPANFSEPPPFTFCPTGGRGDELGQVYGRDAIMKTRAHVGGSERVKKVIKRAMQGYPITIGVLGGSVSSCHGLDATMAHPLGNPIGPNCYPHRIFSWLNDVFPHPANELTNGARESLSPLLSASPAQRVPAGDRSRRTLTDTPD